MAIQIDSFVLNGGLDLQTPYLLLPSGRCIDAVNYENLPYGGYRRIDGYLLYDGQTSNMQAVPGSGPIRGVWEYQGVAYAFRNNAGGTAGVMFKATGAGWVAQSLGEYLAYTTANDAASPTEGTTITGATSGATAVVRRIVIYTGTYASSNVTGLYVISGRVGTFVNGENLQVGGVTKAVASGSQVAITLPAGGSYQFWNYNFLANASSQRMYGVNGVGPAFEWDGTYFTPIIQQVGSNYPTRVIGHADHLFLGFGTDGILRSSGLGLPRDYRSVSGAADIGVGDVIRDMRPAVGGILAVGCANSVKLLYGTSSADWQMKRYSDHGVRANTMKEIGGTNLVLDTRGIQRIDQTSSFGDFVSHSLTVQINKRLLPTVQQNGASVAVVSKNRDQYRIFFGSGGYYLSFNAGKLVGIMPVQFSHEVLCACEGQDTNGVEFLLFGSTDGNVFKMNTGYKFNTSNIQAALQLVFNFEKRPTQRKQYRKAVFFVENEGQAASISARGYYSLYGDQSPDATALISAAGGAAWDLTGWDVAAWADEIGQERSISLDGTGMSMSLQIISAGTENGSHTIQSAIIHWSPRRLMYAA